MGVVWPGTPAATSEHHILFCSHATEREAVELRLGGDAVDPGTDAGGDWVEWTSGMVRVLRW
jgi:hypothetical protein